MIWESILPSCIIHTLARTVGDGEDLPLERFSEAWEERWPMRNEVEMPDLLWQVLE